MLKCTGLHFYDLEIRLAVLEDVKICARMPSKCDRRKQVGKVSTSVCALT